jgi:hypothetical protein
MSDETMKLLSNRNQNPFSKCCMIGSEIKPVSYFIGKKHL